MPAKTVRRPTTVTTLACPVGSFRSGAAVPSHTSLLVQLRHNVSPYVPHAHQTGLHRKPGLTGWRLPRRSLCPVACPSAWHCETPQERACVEIRHPELLTLTSARALIDVASFVQDMGDQWIRAPKWLPAPHACHHHLEILFLFHRPTCLPDFILCESQQFRAARARLGNGITCNG